MFCLPSLGRWWAACFCLSMLKQPWADLPQAGMHLIATEYQMSWSLSVPPPLQSDTNSSVLERHRQTIHPLTRLLKAADPIKNKLYRNYSILTDRQWFMMCHSADTDVSAPLFLIC